MLQNVYFLAKFGFDSAENEPTKILQDSNLDFKILNLANFATSGETLLLAGS